MALVPAAPASEYDWSITAAAAMRPVMASQFATHADTRFISKSTAKSSLKHLHHPSSGRRQSNDDEFQYLAARSAVA